MSCFSRRKRFLGFPGLSGPGTPLGSLYPRRSPIPGSHPKERGGLSTPGLPGPSWVGMAAATWSPLPPRARLLRPRQVGAGTQPRRLPPLGPARPAPRTMPGGLEAHPVPRWAPLPGGGGGGGARREAQDNREPVGTSDLRSPGRPRPPRGPADNRAGTAGLVPGFLHCPAATRPLSGLAALSRRRSREGQGAAGPGTQVPSRARHRGR